MDLQDWKNVPHLHPLQKKVECSLFVRVVIGFLICWHAILYLHIIFTINQKRLYMYGCLTWHVVGLEIPLSTSYPAT